MTISVIISMDRKEYIQYNRPLDLCLIADFHNKIFSHPVFILNCTVILFFRMSGFDFSIILL